MEWQHIGPSSFLSNLILPFANLHECRDKVLHAMLRNSHIRQLIFERNKLNANCIHVFALFGLWIISTIFMASHTSVLSILAGKNTIYFYTRQNITFRQIVGHMAFASITIKMLQHSNQLLDIDTFNTPLCRIILI